MKCHKNPPEKQKRVMEAGKPQEILLKMFSNEHTLSFSFTYALTRKNIKKPKQTQANTVTPHHYCSSDIKNKEK